MNFGNSIAQLSIQSGDGNESITLGLGFTADVYNALIVDTGKGDDTVIMNTVFIGAFAPGTFSIKMGDGYDNFFAENVTVFTGAGVADGGSKVDNFFDGGGNFGFSLVNFEFVM